MLHYHLGHLNFLYLKHLFPSLFQIDRFQCAVGQIAKYSRVFLSQPYCPSMPFSLVHSDVWGPRINTLFNKK